MFREGACARVCGSLVLKRSVTRYNILVSGRDLKLSFVGPTGTRTRGHYVIWQR